jgi:hypothetical protein
VEICGDEDPREEFLAIISGWMLVDDFDYLTEKIEEAAKWTETNGPLRPKEEATMELMIRCQIAKGFEFGMIDE